MKFLLNLIIVIVLSSCSSDVVQKPKVKAPIGAFLNEFNVGFTGYAWEFQSVEGGTVWLPSMRLLLDNHVDTRIKNINYSNFDRLRTTIDNSKFFVMWITKYWKPTYFNIKEIQRAIDYGKIPIFLYWYYGDDFATQSAQNVITKQKESYAKMNDSVIKFINKLNGEVIILLEPEFNKQNILDNPANSDLFITTMNNTLDYFRENISSNIKLYLGLSMNDNGSRYKNENSSICGYDNCALGDRYTWNKTIDILQNFRDKIDIVAFSIMLSPLTRDLNNPNKPHSYSDEKLGIGYLPQRIVNLSQELHTQLNKPVFLSHLVMASAKWNDLNNNQKIENNEINATAWNRVIYNSYSKFNYELFKESGLIGLTIMNLFDNPKHDLGGYNYFLHNEHHLGLISTKVDPESKQANDGALKFKSFNNIKLIDLIYKNEYLNRSR